MEAAKFIVGSVVAIVFLTLRWRFIGRDNKAFGLARRNGISQWQVVPPYDRWGVSLRCDLWTIWGAGFAGILGFGVGLAYLHSTILGVLIGLPCAAFGGWRCRTIMSIILAYGTPTQPDAPPVVRVKGGRVAWAFTGVCCGVLVGVTWAATFHERGPIVLVATAGASVFLAWKLVRMSDGWRRRSAVSAGSAPAGPPRS
jgi:hypothetical protein